MQLDELDMPKSTMNSANKVELFLNKFYSTLSSSYFTSLHNKVELFLNKFYSANSRGSKNIPEVAITHVKGK